MKVIIVGSTHAGTNAALQILRDHPETEVTIYERHTDVSFLSCGISLYLDGQVKHLEDMFYSSPEQLTALGATIKTRFNVMKIDSEAKTLEAVNMDSGDMIHDTYDKLIMATGSTVTVPPIFGIDEEKVLLCKNYDQAKAIYETAKTNKRIAIVGAGYIGTELAESYARTNHEVLLLQSRDIILNHYVDKNFSDRIVHMLEDNGVDVHLNARVTFSPATSRGNWLSKAPRATIRLIWPSSAPASCRTPSCYGVKSIWTGTVPSSSTTTSRRRIPTSSRAGTLAWSTSIRPVSRPTRHWRQMRCGKGCSPASTSLATFNRTWGPRRPRR